MAPVSRHVQHMQLGGTCQLGGQPGQAVLTQREHGEAGAATQLQGDSVQTVAVHVQVGQLLQLPHGPRQSLAREGRRAEDGMDSQKGQEEAGKAGGDKETSRRASER